MKRAPHFHQNEYARLAEVIVNDELRSAIGVLTQGPDRLGLEDGGQDGFSRILEKYNDPYFFPENCLGAVEPAVSKLDPHKAHTSDYAYFFEKWNEAKPIITKAQEN